MGKWINCKKCGHEYHSSLNRCPNCSTATPSFKNIAFIIGVIAVCFFTGLGIFLGFKETQIKMSPEKDSSSFVSDTKSDTSIKPDASEEKESGSPSVSSKKDSSSSKKAETSSSKKDTSSIRAEKPSNSLISDIQGIVSEKPESSDSSPSSNQQAFPIGTVLKNKFAYTTVPKYFLEYTYNITAAAGQTESFEDFAYTLSDEQKAYGFTEITKNSDGSATIAMPLSVDRIKFRTEFINGGIELIDTLKQADFIKDIYGNNEYRDIFFELSRDDLTELELASIVLIGLYFLENQYYEVDSGNTCNVYIKTTDNVYSLLKFPDVLVG